MELIFIGMISGIVTGLGTGGGSILILILTMIMQIEQHTAQAANLIFFIFTSISAIIIYFQKKNVDTQIGKKLLYSVIIGASMGAYVTSLIETSALRKYYGAFLLLIAITDMIANLKKKLKGKKGDNH